MPLRTRRQPVPNDADGLDVGRDWQGGSATVEPGAARTPERECNVDEDESLELVPSDEFDDRDRGHLAILTIPVAYDLLGRNPKDGAALESIRLCVIRWALRDGLASDAEDIAQDVTLKLITPVDPTDGRVLGVHMARGRETFRGFLNGLYLNARKPVVIDRIRRRVQQDIDDLDRRHRDVESTDRDADPNLLLVSPDGIDDRLADALDVLRAANPRGHRVLIARYFRDWDYPEIASELGITEANARQIHVRALRFLRDYLGGTAK
jgi:RNA polymerase sigma factor (sigma-70 family)